MQKSGFMAATVPEELGGLGLDSPHDLAVGVGRLARGEKWPIEEIHAERGRLDEVFRQITRSAA